MVKIMNAEEQKIWSILEQVADPEIPVLTIKDLGILRNVRWENNRAEITITPTYNGCPAMDMIAAEIRITMAAHGYTNFQIHSQLSPSWTTEWMTEIGKQKLKTYGIAPPEKKFNIPKDGITCPHCQSTETRLLSEFGSTACKALYQCDDCKEPFDYFKCH